MYKHLEDTFERFSVTFYKGDSFCDFLLALLWAKALQENSWLPISFPVRQILSGEGSTLKGKNLLPWEQILFFFRVDPFQKGIKIHFT